MSSSPPASSLPSLWCSSCHILVDEFSPSCPLCGRDSIMEITDSRVLAVLASLGRGSGSQTSNTAEDFHANLQRNASFRMDSNIAVSSPQLLYLFLDFMARVTRGENPLENQSLASELLPSSSNSLSSIQNDSASGGEVDFEFGESYETDEATALETRTVRVGEEFTSINEPNDESEESSAHSESFLYPTVDIILHYFVQDEAQRYGSFPASKAAVAALPTFNFCKELSCAEDACCAVCREVFEFGEELKELPCKHFYHSGCILPWLEIHSSCPLCRTELPIEDTPGLNAEDSTGVSSESGEASLALFEISGEGIHVLSFVLFGEQMDDEENLRFHDMLGGTEGQGEDAYTTGIQHTNGNEQQLFDNYVGQTEMTAGPTTLEASVEPTKNELKPFESRIESQIETSLNEACGTSYNRFGVDEPALQYVNGEFESSNILTEGEILGQSSRALHSTLERHESIARGMSGVQLDPLGDFDVRGSWYNAMEGSSGLHDLESFLMSTVGNFLNWLRGISHMSDTENSRHQSQT